MHTGNRPVTSPAERKQYMIKRMSYHQYRTDYYDCETIKGSYDADDKTVEVIVPESKMNFRGKQWERDGNHYYLIGTKVCVRWWNSGEKANFMVELFGAKPYEQNTWSIPGKGARAREAAILKAYELAGIKAK